MQADGVAGRVPESKPAGFAARNLIGDSAVALSLVAFLILIALVPGEIALAGDLLLLLCVAFLFSSIGHDASAAGLKPDLLALALMLRGK